METIDLISFLRNYYGISHEKLVFDKLTHENILELFPFIDECKESDINLEDIVCGNIIGVYDKYKRVAYYYNPHLNIDTLDIKEQSIDEDEEIISITLDDLENLSKEELLKIRRKLRLNNQRKDSYMINGLIKKIKKSEPKNYREKKEKILIKERMNYYD